MVLTRCILLRIESPDEDDFARFVGALMRAVETNVSREPPLKQILDS